MPARQAWIDVRQVLIAALDQVPESRAEFVRHACASQPELLAEVLELLALHEEEFLEQAPFFSPPRELGGYRLLEPIGTGGMGDVYRAETADGERSVAVKLLPRAHPRAATLRERLEREARAVLALTHPNIVRVHAVLEHGGSHAIVMELLEGTGLDRIIAETRPDVSRALHIASQIADALAYAHARGVVHRDLKPANVIVSAQDHATLLDFGIAKLLGPREAAARLTRSGDVLGTPAYMSPEQARGEEVGASSDVFSFGCLLFELLTGSRAFPAGPVAPGMGRAPGVCRSAPALGPPIPEWVREALRETPAARPSMAVVRDVLKSRGA